MEGLNIIRNPSRVEPSSTNVNTNVIYKESDSLPEVNHSILSNYIIHTSERNQEYPLTQGKPPSYRYDSSLQNSSYRMHSPSKDSSNRRSSISSLLSQGDSVNGDNASTNSSIIASSDISEAQKLENSKAENDGCLYLLKALYPQTTKRETIIFFPNSEIKDQLLATRYKDRKIKKLENHDVTFKFSQSVIKYSSVKGIMLCSGVKYHYTGKKYGKRKKSDWYIKWGLNQLPKSFSLITKYQVFNHFPGSYVLGRKDTLYQFLEAMRRQYGSQEYGFFPKTWLLPSHKKEFKSILEEKKSKSMYIMKPSSSCCGRGISIIRTYDQVKKKMKNSNSTWVVQEYISNPLLLKGCKFDLRLYVCVTGYDPLKIYLYNDGLTRISTKQYTNKKDNRFIHLTNFSVQKKGKDFIRPSKAEADGEGHKWSLPALKNYFKQNGIDDRQMWEDTKDLIIKTIISVESNVNLLTKKHMNTKEGLLFELLGFDVLIDEHMKPHILEVNCGPSLSLSSPMDRKIKTNLLSDIYTMVGVQPIQRKLLQKEIASLKGENRLEQISAKSTEEAPKRTLADLIKLDKLDFLTEEDIHIITDVEEELHRRGNFERLFPTKNTWEKYNNLFSCTRYKNLLLHLYYSCPEAKRKALLERRRPSSALRRVVLSQNSKAIISLNEESKKELKLISKQKKRFQKENNASMHYQSMEEELIPPLLQTVDSKQSKEKIFHSSEEDSYHFSPQKTRNSIIDANERSLKKLRVNHEVQLRPTIQPAQFFVNQLAFPPSHSKNNSFNRSIPNIGIPIR